MVESISSGAAGTMSAVLWGWAPSWVVPKYFIFLLCELLFLGELSSMAGSYF